MNLSDRREKLRSKLEEEEEQYRAIIEGQKETTDQRRARFEAEEAERNRVSEEERKSFAALKLEQRLEGSLDEVRTAASKEFHKETVEVLRLQMAEKVEREKQAAMEEKVYEALWQEDFRKKVEREQQEGKEKEAKNLMTKFFLEKQINEKKSMQEERFDEPQCMMFMEEGKGKTKFEVPDLKAMEAAVVEKRLQKEEEKRREREENEKLVSKSIEMERNREIREKNEKLKNCEVMKMFMEQNVNDRMEKEQFNSLIEKAYLKESERQENLESACRDKEQAARRSQLEQVYAERSEQIRLKKEKIQLAKQNWIDQGKAVAELVVQEKQEDMIARRRALEQKRRYCEELKQQISEKFNK